MPDLGALIMHTSLGALSPTGSRCGACQRTPLAGESTHELDSGRVLCELCFRQLPADRRHAVRSERVHATDRPLAVVPRAA
jgi:hypothetical protein